MTAIRLLMFSLVMFASFAIQAGEVIVVLTKSRLGFKEGSITYFLGLPADKIISRFGPAEKIIDDNYEGLNADNFSRGQYEKSYLAYTRNYIYINDGVVLTESRRGAIVGMIFYLLDNEETKAANAITDKGVGKGSSLREIHKIYGAPYKSRQYSLLGYERTQVFYKQEENVLSFDFKDGKLESIGLQADYLPFLNR